MQRLSIAGSEISDQEPFCFHPAHQQPCLRPVRSTLASGVDYYVEQAD